MPLVLTDHERVVVLGVLAGLSNKSIGDKMGITESAIKYHLTRILAKYRVKNRHELMALYIPDSEKEKV